MYFSCILLTNPDSGPFFVETLSRAAQSVIFLVLSPVNSINPGRYTPN